MLRVWLPPTPAPCVVSRPAFTSHMRTTWMLIRIAAPVIWRWYNPMDMDNSASPIHPLCAL